MFSPNKNEIKSANHIDREKIENMLVKYPDKIPIVLKLKDDEHKINLKQKKFLIPNELSVAQFMFTIRKRMTLSPTDAIFIYFNDKDMANHSEMLQTVYERYKNPIDKILYVTIATENTFG